MIENHKNMPNHLAIIMDGNGRWAKQRGLLRSEGHRAGMNRIKKLSEYIFEKKIPILSIFAFSTENFNRNQDEVDYLMKLFTNAFKQEFNYYKNKNIKIVFSGRKEPLSDKVYEAMKQIEEDTKQNTGGILNICLNYGGHTEIIDACKKVYIDASQNKIDINQLDETLFQKYLYQDLEPIDFLIERVEKRD